MPQWRKLHAKTLDSVDVAEMPDDFTRLTWLMLPLIADREGRAIDDANWLRSKLFPLRRDVTLEMIDAVMCWYATRGMIERYEVSGRHYFALINFGLYQGNTEREAESVIPAPVKQARKSKSRPTHELVVSKSMPDVDAEEKRIKTPTNGAAKTAAPAPARDELFDAIAEVCHVDPATAGPSIAKVKQALLKAKPPYTASEVRAFGVNWWSWAGRAAAPTIWKLQETIGEVRASKPEPASAPTGTIYQ